MKGYINDHLKKIIQVLKLPLFVMLDFFYHIKIRIGISGIVVFIVELFLIIKKSKLITFPYFLFLFFSFIYC